MATGNDPVLSAKAQAGRRGRGQHAPATSQAATKRSKSNRTRTEPEAEAVEPEAVEEPGIRGRTRSRRRTGTRTRTADHGAVVSGEARIEFDCFGGRVEVRAAGDGRDCGALEAARARLLDAHRRLSRFDPRSELSRLNRDPRRAVPASPLLRRLAAGRLRAGARSGGLVDATLLRRDRARRLRRPRSPPSPSPGPNRRRRRPPTAAAGPSERGGLGGGRGRRGDRNRDPPARGADRQRRARQGPPRRPGRRPTSPGFGSFAVDCCGDLRLGGSAGRERASSSPTRAAASRCDELRLRRGRGRHQRHQPALLARPGRPPRPPDHRPAKRRAGLHRRRPGDRRRPDRAPRRGLRQVGPPGSGPVAGVEWLPLRRRARPR